MDIEKQVALIESSLLFDAQWYQEQYPDVTRLEMCPARHYLRYGWRVGRNPSPRFDTGKYLSHYQDVAQAGINPLVHYLRNGQQEGRRTWTVANRSGLEEGAARQLRVLPNASEHATPNIPLTAKLPDLDIHEEPRDEAHRIRLQLKQTQQLLEHYFTRCQELEYHLMDQGNT